MPGDVEKGLPSEIRQSGQSHSESLLAYLEPTAKVEPDRDSRSGIASSTFRTLFNYTESSSKKLRSTAWLDGLRGIAAFEVLLYHYHLYMLGVGYNPAYGSTPDTKQWWRLPFIRNYYHSGHAMVNVFFTISGFVLTYRSLSLIRSRQRHKLYESLSSAVFRRAIRIFLPVIAVTFFGFILVSVGLKEDSTMPRLDNVFLQFADWFAETLKFCNPFHEYTNQWDILHRYEHVMWTLPLEYFGSIVCYLCMLGCARITSYLKRSFLFLAIAYLAFMKANWWSANFMVGTMLADFVLWQETDKEAFNFMGIKGKLWRGFWWAVFTWSFYLIGLPDSKPDDYNLPGFDWYYAHVPASQQAIEHGGRFWWMVAGVCLTISISQLHELKRICETRFCQYLGKISFMLYLVHTYTHLLIGDALRGFLTAIFSTRVYSERFQADVEIVSALGSLMIYFIFWGTMLPIVFIVSGAATRYIDDPSIRFARYLELKFVDEDKGDNLPR